MQVDPTLTGCTLIPPLTVFPRDHNTVPTFRPDGRTSKCLRRWPTQVGGLVDALAALCALPSGLN